MSIDIIGLLNALVIGFSSGGSILISRAKGLRDHDIKDFIAGQTIAIGLLFSIFTIFIGLFLSESILILMNTPPLILADAVSYMKIYLVCSPVVFLLITCGNILDGIGNTKISFNFTFFSLVLNIVLDPIFIFGIGPVPEMGVAGAALASMLSMAIVLIFGFRKFFKGDYGVHLKARYFYPHLQRIVEITKLGVPYALSLGSTYFSLIIMLRIVASISAFYYEGQPTVINAYAIVMRVSMIFIFLAFALQKATGIMVGQNIGADKISRAGRGIKHALKIALIISVSGVMVMYFFPDVIARIFISESLTLGKDTISMSSRAFKIVSPSIVTLSISFVVLGAFQGAGKTMTIMLLEFLRSWVFMILPAYLLSFHFGLREEGIWWAMFISGNAGFFGIALYLAGFWKRGLSSPDFEPL